MTSFFVLLATFEILKNTVKNYVKSGTKWLKCSKLCPRAKNWCNLGSNNSPLTVPLTLGFKSQISKGGNILARKKYFSKFSIFDHLFRARIYKYEIKHAGIQTNVQANIGQSYKKNTNMHTGRKDISNFTFKWQNPWCHGTSYINDTGR